MAELESGKRALDEGLAMFEALDEKHRADIMLIENNAMQRIDQIQLLLDEYIIMYASKETVH